jgi:phosphopentomutase
VEKLLSKHFGKPNGRYVAATQYTDFYFANGVYSKLLDNPAVLEEVIAAIQKTEGIARVFRSDLLPGLRESHDPMERAAALNYFPGRSGDLILVPKENWFFVPGRDGMTVATHGTAHPYDARVPVILYGPGIRRGRYSQPATPADIAPTLASLVGLTMPEATGRVLHEALALPEKNQLAQPDSLLDSPK